MSQSPWSEGATPGAGAQRQSGLAITAVVLGILGMVAIGWRVGVVTGVMAVALGVVAVLLGGIALVQIGKPGRPVRGKGLALAGVILGCLAVLMPPVGAAVASARSTAYNMACGSQVRQAVADLMGYAQNHQGDFPPDLRILNQYLTTPSDGSSGAPPAAPSGLPQPYSAVESANSPDDYVYPYRYHNVQDVPTDSPALLIYKPLHGHGGGIVAGFADNTIRYLTPDQARQYGIDLAGH